MPVCPAAIIFLGLPSSGKGTFSKSVSDKFGFPRISFSSLAKNAVSSGLKGKLIKKCKSSGRLVPDRFSNSMLEKEMKKRIYSNGLVLDGFPRTTSQAKFLDWLLKKKRIRPIVFYLSISEKNAFRRLTDRLSCPKCNLTFSGSDFPPRKEGSCDHCGSRLERRDDCSPAIIKKRLLEERAGVRELAGFYSKKNCLHTIKVDGGKRKADANAQRIIQLIARFSWAPLKCTGRQ